MPAVLCPSCHSKLKAPAQLAGKTATCPRCRTAVHVPPAGAPVAVQESKHPSVPARPAEDTVEVAALDDTALQIPLPARQTAAPAQAPAPTERGFRGLWQAGLAVALAASATFALWMATPPDRQSSRTPQVVQPQR